MAEKTDLLHHIPRVKLWLVLVLTLAFTVVLLGASHLTHSLTLRVEAYHALYNLLSLIGCLLTMKVCSGPQSLHNTFGWARLEVLSMLSTQLFLTALCFSVAIDSIQTAVHVGHQDAMHHPLSAMALGAGGWFLNALVFCLIGGYTHHQGCFLEMRDSGSVWVGRQVTEEAVQAGRRMLSSTNLKVGNARPQRDHHVIKEVVRDNCGLVVVVLCAAVVHWDNGGTVALYTDPALAVTSAALLMWFSYPYGKECCHILLQTIPGHIDVEIFQARILEEFPEIVNIHHLHIWTFTPSKVVATAHVVFKTPRVYLSTQASLKQFFLDEGVTQVTLQPEYMTRQPGPSSDDAVCLLRCQHQECHERECCHSCTHHPLLTSVTSQGDSVCEAGKDSWKSDEGMCGLGKGTCNSGEGVCRSPVEDVGRSGGVVCGSGHLVVAAASDGTDAREEEDVKESGAGVRGTGEAASGDEVRGPSQEGASETDRPARWKGESECESDGEVREPGDAQCRTFVFTSLPDQPEEVHQDSPEHHLAEERPPATERECLLPGKAV